MNVSIYSREDIEKLLKENFPNNVAVISFYDPELLQIDDEYAPVDYARKTERVFTLGLPDIDLDSLEEYDLTYDTYFPEANDVAQFIYNAVNDGLDIICQCEYGESRSAGCASAILEHFDKTGISIFVDYRYYPSKLVYHKVFEALKNYERKLR